MQSGGKYCEDTLKGRLFVVGNFSDAVVGWILFHAANTPISSDGDLEGVAVNARRYSTSMSWPGFTLEGYSQGFLRKLGRLERVRFL